MDLQYTDSERRTFVRMNLDNKIEFTDSDGNAHVGETQNLSGRGILFKADVQMQAGDELDIKINSTNDSEPPLNATISIIRSDATDGGAYLVAGEFTAVK